MVKTINIRALSARGRPFRASRCARSAEIHLATALRHALEVDAPTILAVDDLVCANAQALGLAVAP